MTGFGIGTFALKNPGLKLVSLKGRNLTSCNINCPDLTLKPKLPLGLELPLWVLKSVICFSFTILKTFVLTGSSLKSTSPNDVSVWFSDKKLPVRKTSNTASGFVVPSDCVFTLGLNAVLNSTT